MATRTQIGITAALIGIGALATGVALSNSAFYNAKIIKALSKNAQTTRHASLLLKYGDTIVLSSYHQCVQDAVRQGLSPKQAIESCSTNLMDDMNAGFGGPPIEGLGAAAAAFDPQAVVKACTSGNPETSDTKAPVRPPVTIPWSSVEPKHVLVTKEGDVVEEYGGFSYGGDPSKGYDKDGGKLDIDEEVYQYQGLSKEESQAIKEQWVKDAETAKQEWKDAQKALDADPSNKQKEEKRDKAFMNYLKASDKASQDPNLQPLPHSSTTNDPNGSVCEQVMQSVRELLRECNRNGWKSADCQILHARMNRCPDPTKILVDPEAGYVCAESIDPVAVADAAQKRCEQITTPGPDGGTPCVPSNISEDGAYMHGGESDDICRDPRAYTDAETGVCIRELQLDPFGQADIKQILQFGLGTFGGPIVNIPLPPPPPPVPPKS